MKKNILIGIYYNTIGRLFEGAKYYKLDLTEFNTSESYESFGDFILYLPTMKDEAMLEKLYETNIWRFPVAKTRLESGNYMCFAYLDTKNQRLAYTRWLCKNEFHSNVMNKTYIYAPDEAITLDSYTHPDYRYLGLHRKMNIQMLNRLKGDTTLKSIYMVILMFIPYLTKIPLSLGYRPVDSVFYYKKGSLSLLLKSLKVRK